VRNVARLTALRYDHLLEHFKEPPKTRHFHVRKVYGVGMTVAVEFVPYCLSSGTDM
jgi:hypothetical protein